MQESLDWQRQQTRPAIERLHTARAALAAALGLFGIASADFGVPATLGLCGNPVLQIVGAGAALAGRKPVKSAGRSPE